MRVEAFFVIVKLARLTGGSGVSLVNFSFYSVR